MPDIVHLLEIEAPAEVVYRAVTEESGLAGWWTRETTAVPEVGSLAEFRFGHRYHNAMRIVQLAANRYVEWECVKGHDEWIGTSFRFELEETNGVTVLRFSHGNWREMTDFLASCNYHWGFFMHSLKKYCETGVGEPFKGDR